MKLTLLLVLLPLFAFSQLTEDFTDGDLVNGTLWQGDLANFHVNVNKQLQLSSSGEGSSYLATEFGQGPLNEWNFLIKLAFSPSDNNQCFVYLATNHPDPELSTDAYYLKFGKSGGEDAIELYRKSATTNLLIASGTPGFINESFCIRVKVTREDGCWQIWADSTGAYDYGFQVTGNDDHWGAYSWFTILCRHTSSNATKFYFDDIYAGPLLIDDTPPIVQGLSVPGNLSIDLTFNEYLQSSSCNSTANYSLEPQGIFPVAAGLDNENGKIVHLLFQDGFNDDTQYNISIRGIKDVAGNVMNDTTIPFNFHQTNAFDILINEIMADPNPPVSLPDCEYIELYNRTPNSVSLEGWHLTIGDLRKVIPPLTFDPSGYCILTGANDSLLHTFGTVVKLPGFELSNSGTILCLTDEKDAVIHAVSYDDNWYNDNFREGGGWSLELIDPMNPCGGENNWGASIDPSGGTPGRENSIKETMSDNDPPTISFISVPSDNSVTLHFTEPLDSISLSSPLTFNVDNNSGTPVSLGPQGPLYDAVTLKFAEEFEKDIIYHVTIKEKITDCCGNQIPLESVYRFALPYDNITSGIIINEILYDPSINGAEFIEIYNRTDTAFHLKDLLLATLDPITGEILNSCSISENRRIIMPDEYLVLTNDPVAIKSEYFTPDPNAFVKLDDLPSLSNTGGSIALVIKSGIIIDQMEYSDDMHFAMLNNTRGVSLERVNPEGGNTSDNWHSAAQSFGFATPGYRNSQYMSINEGAIETIVVEPQIFSPDNDGYNDQLTISYKPSEPGKLLTVSIFNSEGRPVKFLSSNFLTGSENRLIWDGVTDEGAKAPTGIYIIYSEVVDLKGTVKSYKNVAVVATH